MIASIIMPHSLGQGAEIATQQTSKTGTSHTQLAIDMNDRTTVPKSSNPSPRTERAAPSILENRDTASQRVEFKVTLELVHRPLCVSCCPQVVLCIPSLPDLAGDEERDPDSERAVNQSLAPTSLCGPNPSLSQWGDGKRHGSTAEPFGPEHG